MSYQVIARKWRPKNFSSLVGQEPIATTLLNALKFNRLAHALLFTGPRGTGKTSTARILAKSLRCPNVKSFEPCDECDTCYEISMGVSVDVVEIDGASNNGVDAIRELRDTVHYMPTTGKWKVYIIDEVHMLTSSAFNALLKTLEEPPEHVIFVMATTEVQKIPATILSRCQRFDFRRIPLKQISGHLQKICEAEGITIDPAALWIIARQAEGSMRDSQSVLDHLANYCNRKITVEKVIEVLGLSERALLMESLKALVHRDRALVFQVIEKLMHSGADPKVFAQDLLEQVRNLLIVKMNVGLSEIDIFESEVEELKALGQNLSMEDIHFMFDLIFKGVNDLIRAPNPRVVLEMLLFRVCEASQLSSQATSSDLPPSGLSPSDLPPSGLSPSGDVRVSPAKASVKSQGFDQEKWNDIVQKLQALNALLGAKLANTYFVGVQEEKLIIGLPKPHEFLYSQLTEADVLKKLSNYLNTFTGRTYKVEFVVEAKATGMSSQAKAMGMSSQAQEKKIKGHEIEDTYQLIEANPLVQSVKKHLDAKIQSIKERT